MRSESTRALGQPSETKPTLGAAAVMEPCAGAGTLGLAFGLGTFVGLGFGLGRRLTRESRVGIGEVRERECTEDVAGLLLQLLLHLEECLRALVEVAGHEALDGRALH